MGSSSGLFLCSWLACGIAVACLWPGSGGQEWATRGAVVPRCMWAGSAFHRCRIWAGSGPTQCCYVGFISSFVFLHKMHLHVSIALLFILLTGGFSLECYQCLHEPDFTCNKTMRCYGEESKCENSRRVLYVGGVKHETIEKACVGASACKSWSFTVTPLRMEYSVQCCDSDMCNASPAPDLNSQPNGKKCYSCNWESCSQTVDCMGNENHCLTVNDLFPHSSVIMKGCASEFACGLSREIGPTANVTCCKGNLCNAVKRVSQSFLFLGCYLICYFLLN